MKISKPPKLKTVVKKPAAKPGKPTLPNKVLCAILGHDADPGYFVDSHGNMDGVSFCKRCGEYDV